MGIARHFVWKAPFGQEFQLKLLRNCGTRNMALVHCATRLCVLDHHYRQYATSRPFSSAQGRLVQLSGRNWTGVTLLGAHQT
jgi:hypothetical protein